MKKLWSNGTVFNESCMFAGKRQAKLFFAANEVLKVENPSKGIVYQENIDYTFVPGDDKIELTGDSRIPYISAEQLHPTENLRIHPEKDSNAIGNAVDGGYLLFNNENFFALNQVEVTYRADTSGFSFGLDAQSDRLPATRRRIAEGKLLKVALHGDSISEGYNSTEFTGTAPYLPPYMKQVCAALPVECEFTNFAVGGKGIKFPRSIRNDWINHKPDLMVIAFGMNNFGNTPVADFMAELDWIIKENSAVSPDTEYIIVMSMPGNPEWKPTVSGPDLEYAAAFRKYVENAPANVALADVHHVWSQLLRRKSFYDLTGNGVNHPNDYGHRVYASVILELLPG